MKPITIEDMEKANELYGHKTTNELIDISDAMTRELRVMQDSFDTTEHHRNIIDKLIIKKLEAPAQTDTHNPQAEASDTTPSNKRTSGVSEEPAQTSAEASDVRNPVNDNEINRSVG